MKKVQRAGTIHFFIMLFFGISVGYPGLAASNTTVVNPSPVQVRSSLPPRQENPYLPVASYGIDASLDDQTKIITGRQVFTYTNVTSQPIPDLVFHLYLNAFRNADTIFLRESEAGHRGFVWDAQNPGWIEVDSLNLGDGKRLDLELLADGTLARAVLPQPVMPGATIELVAEFRSQLPRVFARTGFAVDAAGDLFFMAGQWFPKLGVWQDGAWNAYPFHANSEFYADFGTYQVNLTVPDRYITGATGRLVSQQAHADGLRTDHYRAEGVIDFAWTASPNFKLAERHLGETDLLYLYLPEHDWSVDRILEVAKAAVTSFGGWYGPYPYPTLTIVDVPDQGEGAGGMEYPSLVTVGPTDLIGLGLDLGRTDLIRVYEVVAAHEIGHQWWQSVVAFNEAEEPWLDEGFTDYSALRLVDQYYGAGSVVGTGITMSYLDMRRQEYLSSPAIAMDRHAWEYTNPQDYSIAAYAKPALSLLTLERVLGKAEMQDLMRVFFNKYRFTHPKTADFQAVAEQVSGKDLSWFFDGLVRGDGYLDYSVESITDHGVTVLRQGKLAIPTEVQIDFEDGTMITETWSGESSPETFSYPDKPKVIKAQIDPEQKIVVDLYWSNNGLTRRANLSAWIALVTRLLYQFQNILMLWGGI